MGEASNHSLQGCSLKPYTKIATDYAKAAVANPGPWGEIRLFAKKLLEGVFGTTADHFLALFWAIGKETVRGVGKKETPNLAEGGAGYFFLAACIAVGVWLVAPE